MAYSKISTSTARPHQRPSALTLTPPSPSPTPAPEPPRNETARPATHPITPSLDDATHLLHLRIAHLGAGYLSELASPAPHPPGRILQLQRFWADAMREYVAGWEARVRDTAYAGLGLRMLRDAVLRGRAPEVRWLDVCRGEGVQREAVARAVDVWWRGRGESEWCRRLEFGRWRAVRQVECEAEGKRVEGMRKAWLLAGLRGEGLGWGMHCWEFDGEQLRSGVRSLEEEFGQVGEWPEGCGPGGEDDDEEEDGDDGCAGDDEEDANEGDGEQEEKSGATENGWSWSYRSASARA
ncbi:hypothetical protein PMIN04_008383 [Paraphaeosphaeria minitans]